MEEAISTFLALSQARNHEPFLGAFSQVCKLRVRLHIAAIFHISQVCKLEDVSHSCIHQHVSSFLTNTIEEANGLELGLICPISNNS
jgi:hypothetical protein